MTHAASRLRSNSLAKGGASDGAPVCCACGQPVRAGEAHWAGDAENRAWHYGCAERAGITLSLNWLRQRMTPAVAG